MPFRRFFADTSYWIAVANSKDQDHQRAMELSRSFWPGTKLVTSAFVLIEFLNYFSEFGITARLKAIEFVRNIEADPRVEIVELSMNLYHRGVERYERFGDKGWSLTDCISFVIMENEELAEALAFDRHFLQAGFTSPLLPSVS